MTLEEKKARYDWLISQERWHRRQQPSKWHRSQIRWFKRQARRALTLSDIMTLTFRKHSAQLAAKCKASNALWRRACGA
jgi:hypothetical protein